MERRTFLTLAAAAPFALQRLPTGPGPRALVTCDTQARLAVVDLSAGLVIGHVPTLPDPQSIQRVGAFAVVCHTVVGAVSVVDAASPRVLHVLHGFGEPRYVAAHPDGRHAFVTDSQPSGVAVVDVVAGRVVGRLALPGWARHVTLDRAARALWVGLGSASARLAVLDVRSLAQPRLHGFVRPPFPMHDVAFAPTGAVWVTSGAVRRIALYRADGRLVRALPAAAAPQHLAFARGRVFVTSGDDGTCEERLPAGDLVSTQPIPVGSYNVQGGGALVVTPSLERGTLTVLARGQPRRIQVADACHDACFA